MSVPAIGALGFAVDGGVRRGVTGLGAVLGLGLGTDFAGMFMPGIPGIDCASAGSGAAAIASTTAHRNAAARLAEFSLISAL